MVQVGQEIGSGEPAVVAVLLDAGLLGGKPPPSDTRQPHWDEENSRDRNSSNLVLLALLNLVVQAELDQVEHHAEDVLRHVLMIHPDLKQMATASTGN